MASLDLSTIQIVVGIAVATIGIQVTVGGIISRVLWSRYADRNDLHERQMRFMERELAEEKAGHADTRADRDRFERRAEACQDDLDQCRERVRRANGGFRV